MLAKAVPDAQAKAAAIRQKVELAHLDAVAKFERAFVAEAQQAGDAGLGQD